MCTKVFMKILSSFVHIFIYKLPSFVTYEGILYLRM